MNQVLRDHIVEIGDICRQSDVKRLFAFGSIISNDFNNSSDVDLLISFNELDPVTYSDNYFKVHYRLEDLLKRKIDLITENSLHNPFFIESVNHSKQLIYEG